MITLNKEYINQTLYEERLWKIGEADSFNFDQWNLTLRKEDGVYNYSITGYNENGSGISRRYKTMEDAFLHILNRFNENANIKNKFITLQEATAKM